MPAASICIPVQRQAAYGFDRQQVIPDAGNPPPGSWGHLKIPAEGLVARGSFAADGLDQLGVSENGLPLPFALVRLGESTQAAQQR